MIIRAYYTNSDRTDLAGRKIGTDYRLDVLVDVTRTTWADTKHERTEGLVAKIDTGCPFILLPRSRAHKLGILDSALDEAFRTGDVKSIPQVLKPQLMQLRGAFGSSLNGLHTNATLFLYYGKDEDSYSQPFPNQRVVIPEAETDQTLIGMNFLQQVNLCVIREEDHALMTHGAPHLDVSEFHKCGFRAACPEDSVLQDFANRFSIREIDTAEVTEQVVARDAREMRYVYRTRLQDDGVIQVRAATEGTKFEPPIEVSSLTGQLPPDWM